MIDFLIVQIRLGKITIEDVPGKYRQQVKDRLKAE